MQAVLIENGNVSVDEATYAGSLTQCHASSALPLSHWLENPTIDAVQVTTGDDITPLLERVDQLSLIAVHFNDLNDGRGFSIARRLRGAGFTGELRATGSYIRDQLQFLKRCGFNAFLLPDGVTASQAEASLSEISVHYQKLSAG